MTQVESHAETHDEHGAAYYVKIWAVLLALLIVSIVGPMFGIKLLTLATAFGIAVVKAYLVARNFMHLAIEKKYIVYLLCTTIAFMFLFYAGTSPDIMQHQGRLWQNVAAEKEVQRALGAGHGEGG
ncbi:MAG: cytochrome C oxidase subunit IV family protein, partial [Proteobacteria bacterium]|nr:cytochrome C oxidase subunit IV family protein [Pseudomonadota bacterium]